MSVTTPGLPKRKHIRWSLLLIYFVALGGFGVYRWQKRAANSDLCKAVEQGQVVTFQHLLEQGADPNTGCSPFKGTVLNRCVTSSDITFLAKAQIVHLLLSAGAEVRGAVTLNYALDVMSGWYEPMLRHDCGVA